MHQIASLVILGIMAMSVHGQDQAPEKDLHAPRPEPDRIVLTWRQDPARTQSITWRTDTSVTKALVEYEKEHAGFAGSRQAVAVTTAFKSGPSQAHVHSAHLTDLLPDTRYAYRVGDGARWNSWSHFRTASDKPEKFSFLYFGDAQFEFKERWAPLVQAASRAAPQARFSIHAGDLVNTGDLDSEWGEWFQAAAPINATMPVIPTPGNHEYSNTEGNALTSYWDKQFPLPRNGPPGVGGAYYLDYQGVRIISLNTYEKLSEQVDWLRDVLKKNPHRWTVVTFHYPIYSAAAGRDNPEVRKALQPVLDEHRVDLVLQGHDHCYGRSGLLGYEGRHGGTVYVVSVSGPRFNPVNSDKWMVRWGEKIQFFQVITIDGDRLFFEARTLAGELYDSFTLFKRPDGFNILSNGMHDPRSVQPVESRTAPAANEPSPWLLVSLLVVLIGLLVAFRHARKRRGRPSENHIDSATGAPRDGAG
jgi:hypothetical protein